MLVEVQTKPAECQEETLSVGHAHYLRDILTILFPAAQPLSLCEYLSESALFIFFVQFACLVLGLQHIELTYICFNSAR